MQRLKVTLKLLGMACAALCLGATFTWTGEGLDYDWDTCDNWAAVGIPPQCYPSTESDDAAIPYTEGGWTINLIEEQIEDLTIQGSVDFYPASTPALRTLWVESLTIDAGSADTVVTISSDARITTGEEAP